MTIKNTFYSFYPCSTSAWPYSWLALTLAAGREGEGSRVRGSWRWCSMWRGRRSSVRFWGTRRIYLVQKTAYNSPLIWNAY